MIFNKFIKFQFFNWNMCIYLKVKQEIKRGRIKNKESCTQEIKETKERRK